MGKTKVRGDMFGWQLDDRVGALIAVPSGAIDHETADAFQTALAAALAGAAPDSRLIVDLGSVEYMSSVGLRVLMRVSKESRSAKVAIHIAGLNETMAEIFKISRFDKIFPIHETVDDALEA